MKAPVGMGEQSNLYVYQKIKKNVKNKKSSKGK